jgi:hypothetical protein
MARYRLNTKLYRSNTELFQHLCSCSWSGSIKFTGYFHHIRTKYLSNKLLNCSWSCPCFRPLLFSCLLLHPHPPVPLLPSQLAAEGSSCRSSPLGYYDLQLLPGKHVWWCIQYILKIPKQFDSIFNRNFLFASAISFINSTFANATS